MLPDLAKAGTSKDTMRPGTCAESQCEAELAASRLIPFVTLGVGINQSALYQLLLNQKMASLGQVLALPFSS